MNDVCFGLDIADDSFFFRVLRETKKTDYFSGRQYLQQAYETDNAIFNHLQQGLIDDDETVPPSLKRPLSSVAFHFAEDTSSTSLLFDRFDRFKERKVLDQTGLNFVEFLELPRDLFEHILNRCGEKTEKDAAATRAALNGLTDPGKS